MILFRLKLKSILKVFNEFRLFLIDVLSRAKLRTEANVLVYQTNIDNHFEIFNQFQTKH